MVKVRVPVVALLFTVTVKVELPDPATEVGLKVAVTRAGNPLTLRLTVPVNPLTAPIVTVYLPVAPRATVRLAGETEIVKSGLGPCTTRVTVVEWDNVPLVPVMVKGNVPAGVVVLVVTLSVELPEVNEVGLKVAVAPAGNPVTLKLTVPVNPLKGVTVAV